MILASPVIKNIRTQSAFAALRKFPFALGTNLPDYTFTVPPLGVSEQLGISINGGGPALIHDMALISTLADSPALIEMFVNDGRAEIALQSSAVHMATIFGNGINPYKLPETLYMNELWKLNLRVTNLSEEQQTFQLALNSGRNVIDEIDTNSQIRDIREYDRVRLTYPYFYVPNDSRIELAASGADEVEISLGVDCDFELMQLSAISDGIFTINIFDANTGESLLIAPEDNNYEIDSRLLFGSNNFPVKFHMWRAFRAAQKIILQVTDTSDAANIIYPTLAGRNIARALRRAS